MERMINDRLVWFLESNNLISKNQAGFRKNHSTNDHLVRLDLLFVMNLLKRNMSSQFVLTWKRHKTRRKHMAS